MGGDGRDGDGMDAGGEGLDLVDALASVALDAGIDLGDREAVGAALGVALRPRGPQTGPRIEAEAAGRGWVVSVEHVRFGSGEAILLLLLAADAPGPADVAARLPPETSPFDSQFSMMASAVPPRIQRSWRVGERTVWITHRDRGSGLETTAEVGVSSVRERPRRPTPPADPDDPFAP